MCIRDRDKATGKEQSIRIEASSGLSESEIDKMVNDAKNHEQEDKEKREKIDLMNQSEHLIYETEKNIKEYGDKLGDEEIKSLTEKVGDLKKAKDSGNADDIKTAMESLNNAWSQIASKMYDSTKESEGSAPSQGKTTKKDKKEGEIEDADFEVVD